VKIFSKLIFTVVVATLGGVSFAGGAGHRDGNPASLAGKVFYVEAAVLSSPFFPEYEGAVIPSCVIFNEDGSFVDLEWPGEGADPVPGVWIQHTQFPALSFTARSRWSAAGWTLVQNGIVSLGGWWHPQRFSAYSMVFDDDDTVIFYFRGKGYEVDSCPLP
jgi:hypothetical protein